MYIVKIVHSYIDIYTLYNYLHKGVLGIKAVSEETIQRTLQWCNNLPRKLLNHTTPMNVFLEEVNKIVDLDTIQFHIAICASYII